MSEKQMEGQDDGIGSEGADVTLDISGRKALLGTVQSDLLEADKIMVEIAYDHDDIGSYEGGLEAHDLRDLRAMIRLGAKMCFMDKAIWEKLQAPSLERLSPRAVPRNTGKISIGAKSIVDAINADTSLTGPEHGTVQVREITVDPYTVQLDGYGYNQEAAFLVCHIKHNSFKEPGAKQYGPDDCQPNALARNESELTQNIRLGFNSILIKKDVWEGLKLIEEKRGQQSSTLSIKSSPTPRVGPPPNVGRAGKSYAKIEDGQIRNLYPREGTQENWEVANSSESEEWIEALKWARAMGVGLRGKKSLMNRVEPLEAHSINWESQQTNMVTISASKKTEEQLLGTKEAIESRVDFTIQSINRLKTALRTLKKTSMEKYRDGEANEGVITKRENAVMIPFPHDERVYNNKEQVHELLKVLHHLSLVDPIETAKNDLNQQLTDLRKKFSLDGLQVLDEAPSSVSTIYRRLLALAVQRVQTKWMSQKAALPVQGTHTGGLLGFMKKLGL